MFVKTMYDLLINGETFEFIEKAKLNKEDLKSSNGFKSYINYAIALDNMPVLEFLCEKYVLRSEINGLPACVTGDKAYPPLSDAIFYNNTRAVEILHENEADFENIEWDNHKPLYWALLYGNAPIQCFMLDVAKVKIDKDSESLLDDMARGLPRPVIIAKNCAGYIPPVQHSINTSLNL